MPLQTGSCLWSRPPTDIQPYCIDPPTDFADSGYSATEYTYSGSAKWWTQFGISAAQAEAITLALLYGSPNGFTTQRGTPEFFAQRAATQTIIWEILCQSSAGGDYLRSSIFPYTQNSKAMYNTFAKTTMYYNAGYPISNAADCDTAAGSLFANAYKAIAAKMAAHGVTPSFASDRMGNAPSHKLQYNATTGKFEITLTDTNKVLDKCTFKSGNGITYTVDAANNTLKIVVDSLAQIPDGTISISMDYPNFKSEPILIWENGNAQAFASLNIAKNDPVPCYFSLTADQPYGELEIVKETTNGGPKSGFTFEVRKGSKTGELIGTYTTKSSGIITVTDLEPGTYYVIETGSKDYWEYDVTAAKSAKVEAGKTITVTFTNKYLGALEIVKETTNGGSKSGFTFEVHKGSKTGELIGTYTTKSSGVITVTNLEPGTYYVIETGSKDYWEYDVTASKSATVEAGKTITVTFTNRYLGELQIVKETTNGGSKSGFTFEVRKDSAEGELIGTYTTKSSGVITVSNLEPGTYYVIETGTKTYWEYDVEASKSAEVEAGKTITVTFTNRYLGKLQIIKETTNGGSKSGFTFEVHKNSVDGDLIGTYTTKSSGVITVSNLEPGTYYVIETGTKTYWEYDVEATKSAEVEAGKTITVTFTNQWKSKLKIMKIVDAVDPDAVSLKGFVFRLTDSAGTVFGPYTTGKDGTILTGLLEPGEYTVTEILPENSLMECVENDQKILLEAGKTATVTFHNAMKPAKISIEKVDPDGNHLSGAKFMLEWSVDGKKWSPVMLNTTSDIVAGGCTSKKLIDGCLTTGKSGIITFTGLYPQLMYRLTEVEAPEGYQLLSDTAWEGTLDTQANLSVTLTVHNHPGYTLPSTGTDNDLRIIGGAFFAAILAAFGAVMLIGTTHYEMIGNANHKYKKSKED